MIYLIALLEGGVTLGMEIYALRMSESTLGTSIGVTGIILSAVLLALSLGYWLGGMVSNRLSGQSNALLTAGANRLLIAAIAYLTLVPLHAFVMRFVYNETLSLYLSAVVVGLLYALPIVFASGVLPILAELRGHGSGNDAGAFLAVSTVGSVLGATVVPLVLFPTVGVRMTGLLLMAIMTVAATLLLIKVERKARLWWKAVICYLALVGYGFFNYSMAEKSPVYDTAYSSWKIFTREVLQPDKSSRSGFQVTQVRFMTQGMAQSSAIVVGSNDLYFEYAKKIVALVGDESNVAVVGSAGLVLPDVLARAGKNVVAIDIDSGSKNIAERYFLKRPLHERVSFVAADARTWLVHSEHHDLLIMDAFKNQVVPEHLFTYEALQEYANHADKIVQNVILYRSLEGAYSRSILATWKKAFPNGRMIFMRENPDSLLTNVILCSYSCKNSERIPDFDADIYRDDRSSLSIDGQRILAELSRGGSADAYF